MNKLSDNKDPRNMYDKIPKAAYIKLNRFIIMRILKLEYPIFLSL